MTKIKVKIVEGFKKTSGFGWRFVPKWKREFIRLNGMNAFETLTKGLTIQRKETRDIIEIGLKTSKVYQMPNPQKYPDIFKFHNGLDFVGSDTKLLAIDDGIITEVKNNDLSGNYIKVKHDIACVGEVMLSYCHLATHTPQILNNKVQKGEWIAVMGNSGVTSTGVHCHLTCKMVKTGEIIDPEAIFEFEV